MGFHLEAPGRVVSDGDRDAEGIAYLSLEFGFPGPRRATVAAAGVGQNQQFGRAPIATQPLSFPPSGNGMGGESRRVVRDADADGATVAGRVINSIGDSHPAGVR